MNGTVVGPIDPAAPLVVHRFRDSAVVMDRDVAGLFGVTTARLNQQVKRNAGKFGEDFAFQLSTEEFAALMLQDATSNRGRGGLRKPPWMFSEHGVVMAATVLNSPQATAATRHIIRIFIEAKRAELVVAPALPPRGLMQKVESVLDRVLDTIVNPRDGTTLRSEAEDVLAEGLGYVKEWLKRPGVGNELAAAEIEKLLAERDHLRGATPASSAEARIRQLAAMARELRFILSVERARESGSVDELMQVLKELGEA